MKDSDKDSRAERIAMSILGHEEDQAPGVNWQVCRLWTVDQYRKLVRDALRKEGLL